MSEACYQFYEHGTHKGQTHATHHKEFSEKTLTGLPFTTFIKCGYKKHDMNMLPISKLYLCTVLQILVTWDLMCPLSANPSHYMNTNKLITTYEGIWWLPIVFSSHYY